MLLSVWLKNPLYKSISSLSIFVSCHFLRRVNQSACFQRLVRAYETDPSNTKQFMEYMVEAQEFGQPPADLIKEIAPDLELDEHGMPKIDGMPLPNEECQIM